MEKKPLKTHDPEYPVLKELEEQMKKMYQEMLLNMSKEILVHSKTNTKDDVDESEQS